MKKNTSIIFFLINILLFQFLLISPEIYGQETDTTELLTSDLVKAKLIKVEENTEEVLESGGNNLKQKIFHAEVLSGKFKGQVLTIEYMTNGSTNYPGYNFDCLTQGDEVLLSVKQNKNMITEAYLNDYARDRYLKYISIIFILLLVIIGGTKGIKALFTLALTGIAIITVMIPLILKGYNPIILVVIISIFVSIITFFAIGGFTPKTIAAIMGTTGGVTIAGLIAFYIGTATHLTGFSDEEAQMLMYIPQGIHFDFRGLLFAGIIIGALGAIMDVGMSIASAMEEVRIANPRLTQTQLIRVGMNVGRDIMGTMSNTLILAYTGGALPLLLLFMAHETPLIKIINLDMIATEIVRALAGSIGLILAIPITAICSSLLME